MPKFRSSILKARFIDWYGTEESLDAQTFDVRSAAFAEATPSKWTCSRIP